MKVGMNMLLWTPDVCEEHLPLCERLAKLGYDGLELTLQVDRGSAHYASLGRVFDGLGLERTAIAALDVSTNPLDENPAVRAAALERLRWAVDAAAAFGAPVIAGPFHSAYAHFHGRPATQDERGRCAEVMHAAAEIAGAAGITLACEALNRFECYVLNTAAEGAALVKAVDHPSFKLLYDTHHAHIEEKDSAAAIRFLGDSIGHVHVSENDRGTPGSGQVAWVDSFRALQAIGYDGWLMIEAFSRIDEGFANAIHVWREFDDPDAITKDGLAFIRGAWEQAARA
ncbi:MAG: D-psicose/D-tagatose/L-ribulose 3-epimerase [Planctomycetota bacterium]|jgi:D-psicose/D-tagatose/L-ribulose 3-epimerase